MTVEKAKQKLLKGKTLFIAIDNGVTRDGNHIKTYQYRKMVKNNHIIGVTFNYGSVFFTHDMWPEIYVLNSDKENTKIYVASDEDFYRELINCIFMCKTNQSEFREFEINWMQYI